MSFITANVAKLAALVAALVLALAVLTLSPQSSAAPYDSGLNTAFLYPEPVTGRTLDITSYGATPNNSSNDDVTAIQSAINAAVSGDEVYIPNGTYHLKGKVAIILKTGVSVRGESRDGAVLAGSYSSEPLAVLYGLSGVNNLSLTSFKITSLSSVGFASGVRLGSTSTIQPSRVVIKDLFIESFRKHGVELANTRHVLVEGNTIRNATALGGGGSGYGVAVSLPSANNNWVRNNIVGPVIRHALLVQYSANHNLIEGNTVTGAVSSGIDMHGEDEYSNEIRYNTVKDCVRNGTSSSPNGGGIEVGEYSGKIGTTTQHDNSGPYNWIHHNEVSNCTFGMRIVNNSNFTYVEDNNFHHNLTAGLQADLAPLNNLLLARNGFQNNGKGVVLNDVKQATVQDNTITNNTAHGLQTNGGTTGYVITGNIITGNNPNVSLGNSNGTYVPG